MHLQEDPVLSLSLYNCSGPQTLDQLWLCLSFLFLSVLAFVISSCGTCQRQFSCWLFFQKKNNGTCECESPFFKCFEIGYQQLANRILHCVNVPGCCSSCDRWKSCSAALNIFLLLWTFFCCAELVCCFEHYLTVLNVFCCAEHFNEVLNFFCAEHLLLWWKNYAALNILMLCWTFSPAALVHISAVLQLLPCRRIQQTWAPALESEALSHINLSS